MVKFGLNMAAILETILKSIEFARKAGKKVATAGFVEDHDDAVAWDVLSQLAQFGYNASFRKYYDNSYDPPLVSTEYEIKL